MNVKLNKKDKHFGYSIYIFAILLIFNIIGAKFIKGNILLYLNIALKLAFIITLFFEFKLENTSKFIKVTNLILIIVTFITMYKDFINI